MSSLLSEEDLNDFISPALACTKPTEVKKTKIKKSNVNENGEYEVRLDDGEEEEQLEKVSITLSDCLACSGCITSSEEIMLQRQSHNVFLDAMKDRGGNENIKLAISISPQCRLSMATHYDMDIKEFDLCFTNFFKKQFNAKFVVGIQMGRNVNIKQTIDKLNAWKIEKQKNELENGDHDDTILKPKLSASCPGFVIYTEKTKPDLVPLLLNVKSPQQITGALLNETFDKYCRKNKDEKIYNLSLMACFDKKLEASRPDGEGEVDCVITPKEFLAMLSELHLTFEEYKTDNENLLQEMSPKGWDPKIHWANNIGSTSGGSAYQYILYLQKGNRGSKILTIPGKNSNITEFRLVKEGDENITIASASELSGFRNIQNMVRHLSNDNTNNNNGFAKRKIQVLRNRTSNKESEKSKKLSKLVAQPFKSDFIEVNASPGGCINGSGLINNEKNTVRKRNFTLEMQAKFNQVFDMVDPLFEVQKQDTTRLYEYEFHPVEQKQRKDIVTVGNTW